MRCLLLDIGDTDRKMNLEADKLIDEQLPDRMDIFHDTDGQKVELEKAIEKTNLVITKFENQMNEPVLRYKTLPKNANIREEFVRCGKENCKDCSHGPYYYAYWREIEQKN